MDIVRVPSRVPLAILGFSGILWWGCNGGAGDTAGDSGSAGTSVRPAAEILSPDAGATFTEGDAVTLEVELRDEESGSVLEPDSVTWSASGWDGYEGSEGTVTDLPVGELDLSVAVEWGSHTLEDTVSITVESADVSYTGALLTEIVVTVWGMDYTEYCDGTVAFVVTGEGVLEGTGTCVLTEWQPGTELDFGLEGTVEGSGLTGALTMEYEGEVYETPFEGTRDEQGYILATYDELYDLDDYEVRISGEFDGTPQP